MSNLHEELQEKELKSFARGMFWTRMKFNAAQKDICLQEGGVCGDFLSLFLDIWFTVIHI